MHTGLPFGPGSRITPINQTVDRKEQVPHSLLPGSPPPRPLGIAGRKLDVAKGHPAPPLGGSPPRARLEADGTFHQPGAVATAYHQDAAALLASTRGLLEQPLVPPPAAVGGGEGEQGADSASYEEAALRFQRDSRRWLAQFDRKGASDAFITLHEVVQLVANSPFRPDRLALTPAERDDALARLAAAEKLLSREMTQEATEAAT